MRDVAHVDRLREHDTTTIILRMAVIYLSSRYVIHKLNFNITLVVRE